MEFGNKGQRDDHYVLETCPKSRGRDAGTSAGNSSTLCILHSPHTHTLYPHFTHTLGSVQVLS